jgi:non-ribosomal peptide synthetase component F
VAAALAPFLTGPDQVVAVAMSQDNWHIVACHLGILKAGGTLMFLDTTLPDALITHMLNDAQPVVVLTRGQHQFRDLPTLDVLTLPEKTSRRQPPHWLDDPTQRLATIFYTSGTTGMPKGVECPHAGYVNLALSYADYFDLLPGMDATSLTSSLGYDGSISEMYSVVSGCAVMLTKEQIRSGLSSSRPARSRGHGAVLSARAAHSPSQQGRGGISLPAAKPPADKPFPPRQ